ncbi:WD40 repeat domain-containing protein [Streptomyces sp. GbtcB6]|uniref:WD40 repeat domain-containing protein n=1 Tax=Streptomyces sp. GbtcB6 TaxID=2824751 RepID=UPI001C302DA4|nr:WD40 repeat domain-containing protein [Streptomyces sp. GbtcB6]
MGRREKPLDPAAGAVQRFALELRKLRDEAGTPAYRAMGLRAGYSGPTLSAAAAGERLPTLPVVTAYVVACGGDPGEWELRWRAAAAEAAGTPAAEDDGPGPYPGLARFEVADRDHFHGRDDLIAELAAHTRRFRFGAVVGASGSGKSSLLRAGLIPALREAEDTEQRPAAIRILTPGAHPARTHTAVLTPHDAPGDTLLVVDQFEEVFALCADPAERELFIGRLLAADTRLRVLLAVRADFYPHCAEHPLLAEALRDSTLLVGPLQAQRLREAVVRPAAARRHVVERALTDRIVADVAGEPGGLPLMAHALREVWRRRTAKTLALAAYEAIGGVRGAVAHTAEELYAGCTPAEAIAVRALLLRLVNPGDGTGDTRRPVHRAELGTDPTTARVLERLVRARLLTVDGDTVDLAHEVLLGAWPRLRGWIDADRDRLRVHRRLTEAAGAWAELERDAGALYRGVRLTEAREAFAEEGPYQGELSPLEREFLAAGVESYERGRRAAVRAGRRLRALTGALVVLLSLALVAGAVAWRQSGINARQRDQAEARRVAALVDGLRGSEPRTAMRLALAAWRTADLPETRQALRTAAAQSELDVFVQPEEGGRALNAPSWLSSDGRILTAVAHDRAVQWDVRTHRRSHSVIQPGLSEGVIAVSDDGRLIAYRAPGGTGTVIRSLADGRTRRLPTGTWQDADGVFGPDGHTFLVRRRTPGPDGDRATLDLWDVDRQRLRHQYAKGEDDGPLPTPGPDERYLAWCGQEGARLRVLDLASGRMLTTRPPRATERLLCQGQELVFTPDGRAIAAATPEGVVTWDFHTARERPRLPMAGGADAVVFHGSYALTWTPGSLALWRTDLPAPADDGPRTPLFTYPVAGSAVGHLRLDAAAGVLRYREGGRTGVVHTLSLHGLTGPDWHGEPAARAAFDSRGRPVPAEEPPVVKGENTVAADATGLIALTYEGTLVDVATGRRRAGGVTGEDFLRTAVFSPDARYLAAEDANGRFTLWDAHTWRRLAVLRPAGATVVESALGFSADGMLLAASTADGSVQVWETARIRSAPATVPAGDGPVLALGFTAGAGELHIATAHLADRSVPLGPQEGAAELCARAGGGATRAQWREYLPSVPYRVTCGT